MALTKSELRDKKKRPGRNPKTGEKIPVPARRGLPVPEMGGALAYI